jgi:predicted transcriptional regulator YheO
LQSNTASPEIRFFGAAVLREMKEYENSKTVLIQALNHKGIFLYRTAAKKMLSELDAELTALKTDK